MDTHKTVILTISVSIPRDIDPNELDYSISYDGKEMNSEVIETEDSFDDDSCED